MTSILRPSVAMTALLIAGVAHAAPVSLGSDFTSNRYDAMPAKELHMAVVYDGSGTARLGFQWSCDDGSVGWEILSVPGGLATIHTFAYDLDECAPTGRFRVVDVVADGVVDGIAFGMMWKDSDGITTHLLKSPTVQADQTILGVWPLGDFSVEATLDARATGVTSGAESLRTLVPGSALLPNGFYALPIY